MPHFHRQRFGSDARGGWCRFGGRCRVWPNRSARHSSGDSTLHDRSTETVLQPLFSPPLPDGPSLHARGHAGDGRSRRKTLALGGGGAACLSPLVCAPPCSLTATAPFAKKLATDRKSVV